MSEDGKMVEDLPLPEKQEQRHVKLVLDNHSLTDQVLTELNMPKPATAVFGEFTVDKYNDDPNFKPDESLQLSAFLDQLFFTKGALPEEERQDVKNFQDLVEKKIPIITTDSYITDSLLRGLPLPYNKLVYVAGGCLPILMLFDSYREFSTSLKKEALDIPETPLDKKGKSKRAFLRNVGIGLALAAEVSLFGTEMTSDSMPNVNLEEAFTNILNTFGMTKEEFRPYWEKIVTMRNHIMTLNLMVGEKRFSNITGDHPGFFAANGHSDIKNLYNKDVAVIQEVVKNYANHLITYTVPFLLSKVKEGKMTIKDAQNLINMYSDIFTETTALNYDNHNIQTDSIPKSPRSLLIDEVLNEMKNVKIITRGQEAVVISEVLEATLVRLFNRTLLEHKKEQDLRKKLGQGASVKPINIKTFPFTALELPHHPMVHGMILYGGMYLPLNESKQVIVAN